MHLSKAALLKKYRHFEVAQLDNSYPNLSDVKGQFQAKHALEIAGAGGHNMLAPWCWKDDAGDAF